MGSHSSHRVVFDIRQEILQRYAGKKLLLMQRYMMESGLARLLPLPALCRLVGRTIFCNLLPFFNLQCWNISFWLFWLQELLLKLNPGDFARIDLQQMHRLLKLSNNIKESCSWVLQLSLRSNRCTNRAAKNNKF